MDIQEEGMAILVDQDDLAVGDRSLRACIAPSAIEYHLDVQVDS